MGIQKDFEDLCASLIAQNADHLVVGGYALAFHGAQRFRGGLDIFIFIRPTPENVNKLASALRAFGFRGCDIHPDDLLRERTLLQLGARGGVSVCVLGRDAFIANKRAIGRAKDLADIGVLEDPCPAARSPALIRVPGII